LLNRCLFVELNNRVRELELAERDEERRILAELSGLIGAHAVELKYGIENLAVLDLAFAKANMRKELHASVPVMRNAVAPMPRSKSETSESQSILLLRACHPLLDPNTVVPIDIDPRLVRAHWSLPDQIPEEKPFRSKPSVCWR